MQDVDVNGLDSKYLWGKKSDGLAYTIANKHFLWGKLMAIKERGTSNVDAISDGIMLLGAKLKPATQLKKVKAYVEMCQEDGTEYWWDTWCEYVAGNRANRLLDTGDVVSKFHVDCVIG